MTTTSWTPVAERTKYWSPDEAAECLAGIEPAAYAELWSWVGKAEKLSTCWSKLSKETRRQVMLGWKAQDAEYDAIREELEAGKTEQS